MLLKKFNGDVVDTEAPKGKLRIGTVVRIKSWDAVQKVHSEGGKFDAGFTSAMMRYCGKNARIVNCFHFPGERGTRYFLDIDNECYKWTIAMFDWEHKFMLKNE